MWCELCCLSYTCKYREEVEPILKKNQNPYYLRNNKNEETPVKQIFSCDYFIMCASPNP